MHILAPTLALALCAGVASAAPQFATQKPAVPPAVKAPAPAASFPGGGGKLGLLVGGGDDCATPDPIAGQGSFTFDQSAATTGAEGQNESLCYFFGSSAIDADVWFAWTADVTGDATVATCSGTTTDTKLAAYDGSSCPTDGSALACNDDACSLQSSITFPVTSGNTYMIQLGTFPGTAGGSGTFTTSISAGPSANDDCATPDPISGTGLFPFDTNGASTGTQGQNECGAIRNDVWFDWTATSTGMATVSLCGQASFDTKLAAYPSGGCPADGSSLACNDDACSLQSQVSFAVTSGTSYLIQVGAFSSSGFGVGNLDVSIAGTGPVEDDCATPAVIAGQGNFAFDLSGASQGAEGQNEGLCYSFGTSGIDSDVWFEWTADASGLATVTACNNTAVDTKMAAYAGAGCPADGSSIACNDDDCGLQSTLGFDVTSGSTYMLQVGTFPGASTGSGSLDIGITPPISAYCFGDGSGTACPCGNAGGAGEGCANSTGSGAALSWTGSASVGADDLVLTASGSVPSQPGLFFQGTGAVNSGAGNPFGDGLRCANTVTTRLQIVVADGSGNASTSVSIVGQGGAAAGDVRFYQFWYRDPSGSPCGNGFNTTNGVEVNWGS